MLTCTYTNSLERDICAYWYNLTLCFIMMEPGKSITTVSTLSTATNLVWHTHRYLKVKHTLCKKHHQQLYLVPKVNVTFPRCDFGTICINKSFQKLLTAWRKVLTRNIALQHAKQKHDEWREERKNKVEQTERMCSYATTTD